MVKKKSMERRVLCGVIQFAGKKFHYSTKNFAGSFFRAFFFTLLYNTKFWLLVKKIELAVNWKTSFLWCA